MDKNEAIMAAFEARAKRREERRHFLKVSGATAVVLSSSTLLAGCFGDDNNSNGTPMPTPSPTGTPTPGALTDADVLNFALNLEYLEAQFYSYAATGAGLPANMLSGTGTAGAVIGGRKVTFTDPVVRQYANEIAADEIAHVKFLRDQLGSSAVAQPAIDVSANVNGAFSAAARAAGLVPAGQAFDPYASDENFLLGAFIFEDVGVTAYKGAAPLLKSKTYIEASAGILAAEAYHAGLVRTVLYRKGLAAPTLRTSADKISDARDSLDGASDKDQGITGTATMSNIVPTDADGLAFSRTTGQVLNIVYLTGSAAVAGGFFPSGVNGNIKSAAAG
ncbi:ferritin-like domain-containing protein [Novosphingobium sp. G106]|uniref:ferritin-like domain-containing protein n=1 Tax=Novosphingobium sp. G106 TaxID=2849500 RepID=UPI001C2CDB94|nr:ferritin-like domain-containing protein [Novosphingobium sp. G106]MBV1692271.1 ferritin-like domain-containing protein [Novosphingobium sp. G106]